MRFAERELRRRGWREGKGLGKREDGIAEALKVKVKCDTAGVGHNSAEELTFHWWDHVYNSVAANVSVEAGRNGAQVEEVPTQRGAITNKKPRKAQEVKNMLYGRFVKAATLTAGTEEPSKPPPSSSDSSDEDEKLDLSTARRLTDEELVRVCGGRTAHKGARHGLTMSAKLARLEAQEKAFLTRHGGEKEAALGGSGQEERRKGKKRRKRQEPELANPGRDQEEEEEGLKKRKKKKKRKQRNADGSGE